MFFGKSRKEEEWGQAVKGLEAGLKEVKESLENISRQTGENAKAMELCQNTAQEAAGWAKSLEERQQELERQIRRQSDSFEDLLDEIQEERSDKESLREERRENSQKEQALLSLIMCCREQIELLEKQIQGDGSMTGGKLEAWQHQFYAMAQERLKFMRTCGLEEVGQDGEPVDYDIHEVLSAVDTEDMAKAGTVAQVYSHGFLQSGHVIKKARVAAYRQSAGEEDFGRDSDG